MFSFANPIFWTHFFYFFVAIFLAWYIPGFVLAKKLKSSLLSSIPMSTTIGLALWPLQGFIFGLLQVRWLTYGYLVVFFFAWLITMRGSKPKVDVSFITQSKSLFFVIVLGVVLQLTTIFFTGVNIPQGAQFCCGDPTDNIWFAAVTNELTTSIPPEQPGMVGVPLRNYHYFANLSVAELSRVFGLPFFHVQYQYSSLVVSLLLGLNAIIFARLLGLSNTFTFWLLFFLYFGSDAIFALLFLLGRPIDLKMSSLEDGIKFLANFPRAQAMIILFGLVNLIVHWVKNKSTYASVLIGVVAGVLVGFKVYVGIFAGIGLFGVALYQIIRFKNFQASVALIVATVVALVVYLPVNADAGGLYFTGLWRFENFIVQPGLGLIRWELARTIYQEHNNILRVIMYEGTYVLLFLFAIFGTKLVSVIQNKKSLRLFPMELHVFLLCGLVISIILGLFFQQTIGSSNTFNFLVTVFIVLSLYAALSMSEIVHKVGRIFGTIAIIIVVLLTLPRIVFEASRNVTWLLTHHALIIHRDVLEGARFVKANTDSSSLFLVDTRAFDADLNAPLFSFLVDRPMYISGVGLLEHFGVDTKRRKAIARSVFTALSDATVANSLDDEHIDYVIMKPSWPLVATQSGEFLDTIFENENIRVQRVLHDKIKILYPTLLPLEK